MKKRTLIFDDIASGHHLEYIHHLYMGAILRKDEEFIFFLNPDFFLESYDLTWPESLNISIDFISKSDIEKLNREGVFHSYFLCKILLNAVKRYDVTNVFLISLMGFIPFLPFLFTKKIKISGIIYLIYLYRWKHSTVFVRLLDIAKYLLLSNLKIFDNVYLLNDKAAPIYLNRKFKTKVFCYLPDPFVPLSINIIKDLRTELNISNEKIVCLHFGALTSRKGTLEILKAIISSENVQLSKCCFIFAGKIFNDIKEPFYQLIRQAEEKTQILVFDKFCDYDFIGSLCLSSNFILIPYKDPYHSSGVIGYAAQFKIPVVGPDCGLLGKLIRKYKLGVLLKTASVEDLRCFINSIESFRFNIETSYIQEKTVSLFVKTIFD